MNDVQSSRQDHKTDRQGFFTLLIGEMRSLPFLFLTILFLLTLLSDLWMMFDGSGYHFMNFFFHRINNNLDITRYASIYMGELLTLKYVKFGGTNFRVSAWLYNFSHSHHMFYPFFLLVFLKYRYQHLSSWIKTSMYYYVFSLFIYRAFIYYFHMSEIHFAHTLTWISIFLYRLSFMEIEKLKLEKVMLWFTSILSLFTYPITLFTHLSIIADLALPNKNGVKGNVHKKWWILFFAIMTVGGLYLLYRYLDMYSGIGSSPTLAHFEHNKTIQMHFVALSIFFFFVPLFRWQRYITPIVLFSIFVLLNIHAAWHTFDGRIYATALLILIQFYYLVILPRMEMTDFLVQFKLRVLPLLTYLLLVFSYQSYRAKKFEDNILKMLKEQKRSIHYEEVTKLIGENYHFYAKGWSSRCYSLSLQLMNDLPIVSLIANDKNVYGRDIVDILGKEAFIKMVESNGYTIDNQLDIPIKRSLEPGGP